jgi:hypothetical protein
VWDGRIQEVKISVAEHVKLDQVMELGLAYLEKIIKQFSFP